MVEIKHFLKDHAYQNIPLTYAEAYSLGCYVLEGCAGDTLAQIQSIAALSALHTKATYGWQWRKTAESHHGHRLPKTAAEQIAGICAAVFQHDIARSEFGFLEPKVPYAMDNCGMGGDLVVTANVSTIAAFIAAAGGIPICKHGSPANADMGRHGSSDFISMLGINTYAGKTAVEECVEQENFGYTEALDIRYKHIHLQTHEIAKLPHMNDIIGPITNPLHPCLLTRRVIGVNHLIEPRIVAEAYKILNEKGVTEINCGLIVVRGNLLKRSRSGVDELSICKGGSTLVDLQKGEFGFEINEHRVYAEDFDLKPINARDISPPTGMSKGEFSLKILKREISCPAVDMVLANAALLFYLGGYSHRLVECYKIAKDIYESGAAYEKALMVRKRLPSKNS